MNLTEIAIKKKVVTFTFILLLALAGISTYFKLPKAEDPGYVVRTATIATSYPGASPSRVENLVTDKIEKRVQEMPEVDYIDSESREGFSYITVQFKDEYKQMRPIFDKLRRKVEDAKKDLPVGIMAPYVNDDFGDVYGTMIAVTADGYSMEELRKIAKFTMEELLTMDSVGRVLLYGVRPENVFIDYDNAKLSQFGISPGYLKPALESTNILSPGGQILLGQERLSFEPSGNFDSVKDIADTVIRLPKGNLVTVADIATVRRAYQEPIITREKYNGENTIFLAISLKGGGNILDLQKEIDEKISTVEASYPIGVSFNYLAKEAGRVEKSIQSFMSNVAQSIITVMLVLIIFLGVRIGAIVASLIPIVMASSMIFLSYFGLSLDQISLAALIIVLGMLVDNGIVISEAIMVNMEKGMSKVEAALEATRTLKGPLMISSMVTISAFLPIAMADGTMGEYTGPITYVVAICLGLSWILGITLIPLLCVLFLKVEKQEGGYDSKFYKLYRGLLLKLLRLKYISGLAIIGIFIVALVGFKAFVSVQFMPAKDTPLLTVEVEMPFGTSIETTTKMVEDGEAFIRGKFYIEKPELVSPPFFANLLAGGTLVKYKEEGILNVGTFIGESAPRFVLSHTPKMSQPNLAFAIVNATSFEVIKTKIQPELIKWFEDNYPDASIKIDTLQNGAPSDRPIEIRVTGRDEEKLREYVDQVKKLVEENVTGILDTKTDWGIKNRKFQVEIDQQRAMRAGLTSQDIAISLNSILSGIKLTDYREEDQLIPVMLRSQGDSRKDIEVLKNTPIYNQTTGKSVPLGQVATIKTVWEAPKVVRRDKIKAMLFAVGLKDKSTAVEQTLKLKPLLDEMSSKWEYGYKYSFKGEYYNSNKANTALSSKFPIAGIFIFLLLIIQFNSFTVLFTILAALPLILTGITFGLGITGLPFGFMPILGALSLVGIMINNAIVLIDSINIQRDEEGRSPTDAIIFAAQSRFRPIVLTTATTVCGLIPLWLGGGVMFEGMAVTMIFGLIFCLGITLGIIPILYSIFHRISFKDYIYKEDGKVAEEEQLEGEE
jgi:multidrug efflux pump subunit AcrB